MSWLFILVYTDGRNCELCIKIYLVHTGTQRIKTVHIKYQLTELCIGIICEMEVMRPNSELLEHSLARLPYNVLAFCSNSSTNCWNETQNKQVSHRVKTSEIIL